jgi:hypothetical protein
LVDGVMSVSQAIQAVLIAVGMAAGCGPSVGDDDADAGENGEEGEVGEPDDDLSWLLGKFVKACGNDFDEVYVNDCSKSFFHEIEFHADGTMTGVEVMCGNPAKLPEVAVFGPGPVRGAATLEPADGFDHVYISGGYPAEASLHQTEDCFILEVRMRTFGSDSVHYYSRGSFGYIPPVEGCAAEIFPTEVPDAPNERIADHVIACL